MTAIVALTDGQTIVLGGDSAGASRNELRLRADPKVFVRGSYAIGFTTSFRMGQILRWGVDLSEPPTVASAEALEHFLVTELVETLRREFAAKGFAKRTRATIDGDPSATEEGQDRGGLFLLGVGGQIFEIRSDFQVARPLTPLHGDLHGS